MQSIIQDRFSQCMMTRIRSGTSVCTLVQVYVLWYKCMYLAPNRISTLEVHPNDAYERKEESWSSFLETADRHRLLFVIQQANMIRQRL
jgi:hypothetical protein